MRRANIFWGGALILFGVLFLLQAQGLIGNVFNIFWPLIFIFVGGWMVVGVYWKPTPTASETFSIALGEAKNVKYKFSQGAAQINISGGAAVGQALVGSSAAGMNYKSHSDGDRLIVKVDAGPSMIPFVGPNDGVWRYQLTQAVPISLDIDAGASQLNIDLTDVLATRIEMNVGASNVNMTLPARGASLLDIEAGAASINLRVPDATAARIRVKEGATALNVDRNRFPQLDSGIYQSSNFDTSPDRAEINVEAGFGSITVK